MSSMCSMPTQRSDSGGSPAASSDGTSALTTGPRTVERIVSACVAAPRTLMLDMPLVECRATYRRRDSDADRCGSICST